MTTSSGRETLSSATIEGKEYLTVKDFANVVGRSYTTIYMLAKYGTMDGTMKLESIFWNNRLLILKSETEKIAKLPSAGRPIKEKTE